MAWPSRRSHRWLRLLKAGYAGTPRLLRPTRRGHEVKTIQKEALVFNLVRLVMAKAARNQRVTPDRISFIHALRWLQPPKPDAPVPELMVNPCRPGRVEPRCIKRRMRQYGLMKVLRHKLRKRLIKREDAA